VETTLAAAATATLRSNAGGARAVVEDALAARRADEPCTLALVADTEGSTYVGRGALALFGPEGRRTGWLSGGCLEPELESRARAVAESGTPEWIELDTRDDAQMFSGTALGCRGVLRLVLLPLRALDGFDALATRWLAGEGALAWRTRATGEVECRVAQQARTWHLAGTASAWAAQVPDGYVFEQRPPPHVLVCGAGPEAPVLLPLLHRLGSRTTVVEARPRWRTNAAFGDRHVALPPASGIARAAAAHCDAALVVHHGFELDGEALEALAATSIGYIGLLGPVRRRDELLRILPAAARAGIEPRLRSPIGMRLGGHGPEAIALSIAAQLQSCLHDA
jgi:xanthine dehydrogenase accessory factor